MNSRGTANTSPTPRPESGSGTPRALSFVVVEAEGCHLERLQEIEVDAGQRFRSIGLDRIADDAPPSTESLVAYVEARTAWVAVDHTGAAIGYATASHVDGEAHLDQVSVVRSATGHGVGVALIETVCDWARQQGLGSITLTTFRDVAWNGPYYQRHGFTEISERDCGPDLAQILIDERRAGIAVVPRIAMRRHLDPKRQ